MNVRTATAGGLLAVSAAFGVALAGPAAAACDAYSQNCTEPPTVLPTKLTEAPTAVLGTRGTDLPDTLPFTGGELVLLTTAGAAAVAGGTALVVAGRRRKA